MIRPLVIALVVLAASAIPPARPSADAILVDIAERHRHSFRDGGHLRRDGDRLYSTCGYVALYAKGELAEHGYASRVVAVVTRGKRNGYNDGHTMLEVDGRLWDLDLNRRAAVNVAEQVQRVKRGTARWTPIARDPLYDPRELRGMPPRMQRDLRRAFTDSAWFDRRVFGRVG